MSPKNATTNEESGLRTYRWQGRDLDSVTSLRKLCGMPYTLHNWSESQIIDVAVSRYGDLRREVMADPDAARKWLRREANAKRDRARDLGIRTHEAAAAAPGTPVDSDVEPFLNQYLHFLDHTKVNVLLSERQVFNLTLGYAGTLDLVLEEPITKRRVVTDIKTGDGGLWADYALQLYGYALGEFIGQDDVVDPEATDILHSCVSIAVLKLRPEGWEWVEVRLEKVEAQAFRALVTLSQFLKALPNLEPLVLRRETGSRPSSAPASTTGNVVAFRHTTTTGV